MSRFASLLERYQDGEETPEEAEELAALLRGDERRSRQLYDALMLEADLYESYGGVVRLPSDVRRRWTRLTPRLVIGWTVAVFMLIGLAVLLFGGRPIPQHAPPAPAAPPRPEPRRERHVERDHDDQDDHEDHDGRKEGSKENESEREFQKGMREVERKRLEGRPEEAEKKLREIEREREKKRRERERRGEDR